MKTIMEGDEGHGVKRHSINKPNLRNSILLINKTCVEISKLFFG